MTAYSQAQSEAETVLLPAVGAHDVETQLVAVGVEEGNRSPVGRPDRVAIVRSARETAQARAVWFYGEEPLPDARERKPASVG
jgi:hypothetical protein